MNKLIEISCVAAAVVFAGPIMADDTCQTSVNNVAASLAAADRLSAIDKATKCNAFTKAWLVSMDSLSACMKTLKSEPDKNAFTAKFKPLMGQLAQGERTYCAW